MGYGEEQRRCGSEHLFGFKYACFFLTRFVEEHWVVFMLFPPSVGRSAVTSPCIPP